MRKANRISRRSSVRKSIKVSEFLLSLVFFVALSSAVWAQPAVPQLPRLPAIDIRIHPTERPDQLVLALEIAIIIGVISLAPAIMLMTTSFLRISVVLSFLRQALGTPQVPSTQVIFALSIFLTIYTMYPIWMDIYNHAIQPYLHGKIGFDEALSRGVEPLRHFMAKQTRKEDLTLFLKLGNYKKPKNLEEVPLQVLIPAFMVSELRTAFQIGFVIYLPFLVIDMVVASVLLSMGMLMLPPMMVSLPFKILLFILVDGWNLVVKSLVESFVR